MPPCMNHWTLLFKILNSYTSDTSGNKDFIAYKFIYPEIEKEANQLGQRTSGTTEDQSERLQHQGTSILTNFLTAGGLGRVEDEPASLHSDIVSRLRDFIVEGH